MDRLLLRVEEAAERTGLSRSKGYELVATGEWPSVKVGRARRVPLASLVSWINRELDRSARIDSAGSIESTEANVAAGPAIAAMTMGVAATGSMNRRARTTTNPDVSIAGDNDD